MKIEKFEEIESWKGARELAASIYKMTKRDGLVRDFGLKDQIQRASVSVMAHIAEGFDSGSKRTFILFLKYTYRSASEVQSRLYFTLDCNYITQYEFEVAYKKASDIKNLIGGFMNYLQK